MKIEDIDPALKACMRHWRIKARGQTFKVAAFDQQMAKDLLSLTKGIPESEIADVRECC